MVGIEVAREVARKLFPQQIVISALSEREVNESLEILRADAEHEGWKTSISGVSGDIFIPQSLQGRERAEILRDSDLFDEMFEEIFSPEADAYKKSALYALINEHKPDVIIDCINTATAISYQDVFTTSRKVKLLIDRLEQNRSIDSDALPEFVESIRELLIAQGVPLITRHILFLHQALKNTNVHVYVKVGTTGTGGMGVNIPYTHSEDKPSATLLSKSAVGFAHTGLLFLLARTPGGARDGEVSRGTMIKEVKPGAMIGFKRLGLTHVRLNGPGGKRAPGYLLEWSDENLTTSLQPRSSYDAYPRFDGRDVPVRMIGADTGENGFFSIGEFEAITYPRQMEYVTPEEVARAVVLEILGSSTGRDVIAAIDGAITEPSYRAGVLRDYAIREMERLEALMASDEEISPSVAVGHLGPPRLSKLLIEAYLVRAAAGSASFSELVAIAPEDLKARVASYLAQNRRIVSLITTIGIPLLWDVEGKLKISRGPRLNIPVPRPDGEPIALTPDLIERYAHLGWVDLRLANFETWHERMQRIIAAKPDIVQFGSAAFDRQTYLPETFSPGDVVGWLLSNEVDEQGMVGHRIL